MFVLKVGLAANSGISRPKKTPKATPSATPRRDTTSATVWDGRVKAQANAASDW